MLVGTPHVHSKTISRCCQSRTAPRSPERPRDECRTRGRLRSSCHGSGIDCRGRRYLKHVRDDPKAFYLMIGYSFVSYCKKCLWGGRRLDSLFIWSDNDLFSSLSVFGRSDHRSSSACRSSGRYIHCIYCIFCIACIYSLYSEYI